MALESIQLLFLVVTLLIGLASNFRMTQFTLIILGCYCFPKSLQIPKTFLSSRIRVCLMGFHGPPRIQPVRCSNSSIIATMLNFLRCFTILILVLKMYLVLMHVAAGDNGCPAKEMAFAMFSVESHI